MQAVFSRIAGVGEINKDISPTTSNTKESMISIETALSKLSNEQVRIALEKLHNATFLSEKKQTITNLIEIAPYYKGDIGSKIGISLIIQALLTDPRDTELIEGILELIQEILTNHHENCQHILEKSDYIELFLGFLEDSSAWIRSLTVGILKLIQEKEKEQLCERILECQQSLRRLMTILEDPRDDIRYNMIQILLNLQYTKEIQQFLAFEEIFDHLYNIMELEGMTENGCRGNAIINDALKIIDNVIRMNDMTKSLFIEKQGVMMLARLLTFDREETVMESSEGSKLQMIKVNISALKEEQLNQCFRILHELFVTAKQKTAEKESNRKFQLSRNYTKNASHQILLEKLCTIAFTEWLPISCAKLQNEGITLLEQILSNDVQLETIMVEVQIKIPSEELNETVYALSECIRLSLAVTAEENKKLLSTHATKFISTLLKNEMVCMIVVQHMVAPPPPDPDINVAGPTLGETVISIIEDNMNIFLQNIGKYGEETTASDQSVLTAIESSLLLFRTLLEKNVSCKELAMRLSSQGNDTAKSLYMKVLRWFADVWKFFSQLQNIASRRNALHVMLTVAQVLVTWTSSCATAIAEITSSIANMEFLLDIINSDKTFASDKIVNDGFIQLHALTSLIISFCLLHKEDASQVLSRQEVFRLLVRKVGIEKFTDILRAMTYSKTFAQTPYDKEFITFYRETEKKAQKVIYELYTIETNAILTENEEMNNLVTVQAYQELIRMQDKEIKELKSRESNGTPSHDSLQNYEEELKEAKDSLKEAEEKYEKLKHENQRLEKNVEAKEKSIQSIEKINETIRNEKNKLQQSVEEIRQAYDNDEEEIQSLKAELQKTQMELEKERKEVSSLQAAYTTAKEQENTETMKKGLTTEHSTQTDDSNASATNPKLNDHLNDILLLLGNYEIERRAYRDTLQNNLGDGAVEEATRLARSRGAIEVWKDDTSLQ